jgi:hypothetical protein
MDSENKSRLQYRKDELASKLLQVRLPYRKESTLCWEVGSRLGISGVSVRNYLSGKVSDGYLGEEILSIFEGLGFYDK